MRKSRAKGDAKPKLFQVGDLVTWDQRKRTSYSKATMGASPFKIEEVRASEQFDLTLHPQLVRIGKAWFTGWWFRLCRRTSEGN